MLQVNRLKVHVYQKILKLDQNYELNDEDLLIMADKNIEIIWNNKVIYYYHDNKLYIFIIFLYL